jgi:3-phosphoshikimate 1-carboxyvinyltransferase
VSRLIVRPSAPLRGRKSVPGDKSISHRALLLSALSEGASRIDGFLPSSDCLATLTCLRALGVQIEIHDSTSLTVHGRGLCGLQAPTEPLNCSRSGTTMRLLAGVLAGQAFTSALTGDPQLLQRPMRRIADPIRRMGGEIETHHGHAPLTIRGRQLRGCEHTLPVASAQVKSALLLAGLYADGPTIIHQPGPARDHTERMLAAMGALIETAGLTITLHPSPSLSPGSISVPGDLSSAAFPLVAAALVADSGVTITGMGVNPTRTGLLDVLDAMGCDIQMKGERNLGNEPVADVTVRASRLVGVQVCGHTVVRMIDELPVLAVAATQAHGTTVVRDAAELRVKETDRIATVVSELQRLGACIEANPDGFLIEGPTPLHGAVVDSHKDHRLAMALSVAGLIAQEKVVVENSKCMDDSFPGFVEWMRQMGAQYD